MPTTAFAAACAVWRSWLLFHAGSDTEHSIVCPVQEIFARNLDTSGSLVQGDASSHARKQSGQAFGHKLPPPLPRVQIAPPVKLSGDQPRVFAGYRRAL